MKQYEQFHWQSVRLYERGPMAVYFLGFDDADNILFTTNVDSAPQGVIHKYTDAWNHIKEQLDALLVESDKSPTELKWQTGTDWPKEEEVWILVQYCTGTYQALHTNTPALPFPVRRWAVLP